MSYPTRNFALALPWCTVHQADGTSLSLHRAIPACRHADGTISSSGVPDVRRMASEDSDQLAAGFPVIHGLDDLCDLDQTLARQMLASSHLVQADCETLEVEPL